MPESKRKSFLIKNDIFICWKSDFYLLIQYTCKIPWWRYVISYLIVKKSSKVVFRFFWSQAWAWMLFEEDEEGKMERKWVENGEKKKRIRSLLCTQELEGSGVGCHGGGMGEFTLPTAHFLPFAREPWESLLSQPHIFYHLQENHSTIWLNPIEFIIEQKKKSRCKRKCGILERQFHYNFLDEWFGNVTKLQCQCHASCIKNF